MIYARLLRRSIALLLIAHMSAGAAQDGATPPRAASKLPDGWELLPKTTSAGVIDPEVFHANYPTVNVDDVDPAMSITDGGGFTAASTLRLAGNTTYTLAMEIGNRPGAAFGGFDIQVATATGIVVGEWVGVSRNLVGTGLFGKYSRRFSTIAKPIGKGQRLILTVSQPAGTPAHAVSDLGAISLTAEPSEFPYLPHEAIDVMVVAGQSNAEGWMSNVDTLTPELHGYLDDLHSRVLLAYDHRALWDTQDNTGTFAVLAPQGTGFSGGFSGFGPELSLGVDLGRAVKHRIAVIKYAIGAAGLDAHFKQDAHLLYQPFITCVAGNMQRLLDQGLAPRLCCLFWLQGETDALAAGSPQRYGANITSFLANLRSDWQAPHLECVLTEINVHMPALEPHAADVALVNQGMMDLAAHDPLVRFVPTADITSGWGDGIHYSATQQIDIGSRWAQAYLDLNQHPARH